MYNIVVAHNVRVGPGGFLTCRTLQQPFSARSRSAGAGDAYSMDTLFSGGVGLVKDVNAL